jgi:alkylhydroperoxidase family enzyme
MSPRIPLADDAPGPIGVPTAAGVAPDLDALRARISTSVPVGVVHPVTAEVVRLRNARRQGCCLCQSMRYHAATEHGATEEVLAHEYVGRTDHDVAAIRLCDAFLDAPAELGTDERQELLEHLSPGEVVELVGRLANWTYNKVMISLGMDLDRVELRPFPGEA